MNHKIIVILLIATILVLGSFKFQILEFLEDLLQATLPDQVIEYLSSLISRYGSTKTAEEWVSHYCLYYPTYLVCHFTLIQFIFFNQKYLRRIMTLSLIGLLIFLIAGKIIFGLLNLSELEEYFSFAFHKLIALPFLLLVIEGGRQLYEIIDKSKLD